MNRYEEFEHTADIGVRVYGSDLKELFANAAFSMFDIIADLEGIESDTTDEIKVNADTFEELLVAWLDELLYRFYTRDLLYFKFEIEDLSENYMSAKAFYRPVGVNRNRLKTEIKAATYHNLKIEKSNYGYKVEIIFDV